METANGVIQQQATEAVQALDIQDLVLAAEVAESVLRQAVYWEKPLPTGDRLLFVRLFSPVVMREEVFLGNVLFNAFLGQAFARAVERIGGQAAPVANDLENYYFVVRTDTDLLPLATEFRAEVERSLPELFFGKPDPGRGVYGDLSGMFTFRKSDFEPFPVYAVPEFLDRDLEKAIRQEISKLLQPAAFEGKVARRTALAALAFFYGRTSGGMGDTQSFSFFIEHLTNESDYDGLLQPEAVRRALNTAEVTKAAIKKSLDDEIYSQIELRQLLAGLLAAFAASIEGGSDKWLMGFLHKDGKFIDTAPEAYVSLLLADTQVGHVLTPAICSSEGIACRLCHTATVMVQDRYVVTGLTSFKFHNQSVRGKSEKLCARCALYSYLAQKLLGTATVSAGGKLPQIPKTYNLIFHYGKHTDAEVARLVQQIDRVWDLVSRHREAAAVRRDVAQAYKALAQKAAEEQDVQKHTALETELAQKQAELQRAQAAVAQVEDDIYADCPWMRDMGASPVPYENPALDVLGNWQLSESKVERHILGLGMGGHRMILFVLPQIRAPRNKERDFAQSRFSDSWVTVTAFLSFLHSLCGCNGSFYYESLPTLTTRAFQPGMFYIRNRALSVQEAQSKYAAIYDLAWQLIWQRGPKGFVKKVILAERLLADPLGTFSTVMRDSPILGRREGGYRRLKTEYRRDWDAEDLTEYTRFIQQLANL
ncbi:MAG: hypothetical protein JW892_09730 [Anaerolineae bacterium]|nr:hypothetical protein [Anaerolineae bacterium]